MFAERRAVKLGGDLAMGGLPDFRELLLAFLVVGEGVVSTDELGLDLHRAYWFLARGRVELDLGAERLHHFLELGVLLHDYESGSAFD